MGREYSGRGYMNASHVSSLSNLSESRSAMSPPRFPATAFPRPRLIRRLDDWSDVTVVHGPVGAGKTTLLSEWANSATGRLLWCVPQSGCLPMREIEVFASEGAGSVVIDQAEGLELDQILQLGGLFEQYTDLRLVIATRSARTVYGFTVEIDAGVDVISADDLLVTEDDLRDAGVLDDEASRMRLLRETGGLAVAVRAQLDDVLGTAPGAYERFRRRLCAEANTSPEVFETALRIAFLPRIDVSVISAWELGRAELFELDDAGLTHWDGTWLSMHPFIRGVFLEEALHRFTEAERRHLIEVAVRRSLIVSDPVQALHQAFTVDDLGLASDVAFESIVELVKRRDETYALFSEMTASRLRGYPSLIVLLIVLSNMHADTRPRAVQILASESLFQRLQPYRFSHRERVVYRAFEAAIIRLTPFAGTGRALIRRALDDVLSLSEEDMEALGRLAPLLLVHLGIGAFYQQEFNLARRSFDLAYARHVERRWHDRVDSLSLRAGLAALTGDLPLARQLLNEADIAEWPEDAREMGAADFFHLGNAVIALEAGDVHAAQSHLEAAGPPERIIEHWGLYALIRARCDRLAGAAEAGLLRVRRVREQREGAPMTALARNFIDAAEAEMLVATGDLNLASRIAARSVKNGPESVLVLARIHLALDRPSKAAVAASRVLSRSEVTLRNRVEAELVLIATVLRADQGDSVTAIAERIAEIIHSTDMREPLRNILPRDHEAVAAALGRAGVDLSLLSGIASEVTAAAPAAVFEAAVELSAREESVLVVLAETPALDEIASQLYISRNTVKSHLHNIYRKLGASSREEALTRAAALGLLTSSSR